MFHFASPHLLLLLLIVPAAVFLRRRGAFRPVLGMSDLVAVRTLRPSFAVTLARALPLLKYAALVLMVLALARPQWGTRQVLQLTEGVNIILAVDVSESMAAMDFTEAGRAVDRLAAVKRVVRDFVRRRDGDRIGLVVFGTHAYTQLPMTRDYRAIVDILERIEIGAAGKSTAIGDAIGISLKRIQDVKSVSNVIILMTDGRSNTGEITPEVASEIAFQKKVRVYTIGVGSRGRAPFIVDHPLFGRRTVYRQVDIDEETLQRIADKTGGKYFRAEDTAGLESVYDTIDGMEKTEIKTRVFENTRDLYPYCLLPAMCLLVMWIVLAHTRFLRVP